jgi:hypothetical protein
LARADILDGQSRRGHDGCAADAVGVDQFVERQLASPNVTKPVFRKEGPAFVDFPPTPRLARRAASLRAD